MPIIFYERYYTPIDRLLNKLKRKGFWLYTGLVCFSLFYLFYEVSNLPSLPPPPPTQDPKNLKKSLKRAHTPKELRGDDDGKKKVRTEVVVTETVIAEAATPSNTIS